MFDISDSVIRQLFDITSHSSCCTRASEFICCMLPFRSWRFAIDTGFTLVNGCGEATLLETQQASNFLYKGSSLKKHT